MKNIYTIFALIIFGFIVAKSDEKTVELGAGYENDIWFNLDNGSIGSSPNKGWDVAFQVDGNGGVRLNTSKGLQAWVVPDADEDSWGLPVDTTVMSAEWNSYYNSNESWNIGAFNLGIDGFETEFGDFGWGMYNMSNHSVTGKTIFVVKIDDVTYKQFFVKKLFAGVYTFAITDLDGTNEVEYTITNSEFAGKRYAYFNFSDGAAIDLESATTEWDFVFGKYTGLIDNGESMVPYSLTGVRNNTTIQVEKLTGVDREAAEAKTIDKGNYSSDLGVIGSDWKSFNMTTFQYDLKEDWVYFLAKKIDSVTNRYYRLYFTEFGGSSTGTIKFELGETEANSVYDENGLKVLDFAINPNVISNSESINLLINTEENINNIEISINGLLGNRVYSQTLNNIKGFKALNIDNLNLTSGMYLVNLHVQGKVISKKIIVE